MKQRNVTSLFSLYHQLLTHPSFLKVSQHLLTAKAESSLFQDHQIHYDAFAKFLLIKSLKYVLSCKAAQRDEMSKLQSGLFMDLFEPGTTMEDDKLL